MSKGIQYKVTEYLKDKVKRHFIRKYGLEAIGLLHGVGQSLDKPVWLFYGTLLGAYRENGFIRHDFDIDLCMYAADFDYAFQRAIYDRGFKLLRAFYAVDPSQPEERRVTEVTLKYRHVYIDIFLRFREEGHTYGYVWDDGDVERNVWLARIDDFELDGFVESDFLGIMVLVPTNTREFLAAKYGDDFMTPRPGWQPQRREHVPLEQCHGEVVGGWI